MVGRRWCSKHGHNQDLKSKDSWLRMNKVKKDKYCTFEVRCHDLLVIWIISNGLKKYHPNDPLGELFQEMILRNPQALYVLRNLEKFENSIKIHFFIREIVANFNNFQGSSTSAQKLLLTWCCTCIYQLLKALRLHKNVSQNNFSNIVLGFHFLHLDCVLFWRSKQRPTLTYRKKSILVCLKLKIWLD